MEPNLKVPWLGLGGEGASLCLVLRLAQVRDSRKSPCVSPSDVLNQESHFPGSHGLLASGKDDFRDPTPIFQACSVNPKLKGYPQEVLIWALCLYLDSIPAMGSKLSMLRHSLNCLRDNLKELQLGELRLATLLHLSMQILLPKIQNFDLVS